MIPAYDDPKVWEGHATIITEISKQMSARPDAIFCSIGGGGLLGGLIVGCQVIGSDSPRDNWVRLFLPFNVTQQREVQ